MADIHHLVEDQKDLFSNLQRTARLYNSRQNKTHGLAQSVLDEIESNFLQFKDGNTQLCAVVRDNTINTENIPYFKDDVYYKFQDEFFTLKSQLLDFMESSGSHSRSPGIQSSTFAGPSHSRNETFALQARLPKIDLPVFSGDYLTWMSYQDMFVSLVHNNSGLTDVQKFCFLKNSCKGTPLDIVNEYPATDSSYNLAWTALQNRYHNKRKIVDTIFKKLFSISASDGSSKSIQTILDTTRTSIALLRTLEVNTEGEHAMLIYMTVNKLDIQTRKEWEQSLNASTQIPPIEDLFKFLEATFRTLETISDQTESNPNASFSKPKNPQQQNKGKNNFRRYVNAVSTNTDSNCPCCNKRHLLFKCFKFAALASTEKRDFLNSKRICRNCLAPGHFSNKCHVDSRCQVCQQNHHTTVHNEYFINRASETPPSEPATPSHTPSSSQVIENVTAHVVDNSETFSRRKRPQVLLATMRVVLKTAQGDFVLRALLDQCAQATFITKKAADALNLSYRRNFVEICGVGGSQPTISKNYVNFSIFSRIETNFKIDCEALVLSKITAYQPMAINEKLLPDLKKFSLADPSFSKPGEVDLLLGGDVYGDIVLPQQHKFNDGLFLQFTHFGWIVSGPSPDNSYQHTITVNVCSLDKQLQSFWEQEELLEKKVLTEEEILCEQHFKNTTSRNSSGRYTVSLPFKSLLKGLPLPVFAHTDYAALSRLKNVETKCKLNKNFGKLYTEFMEEYERLGHMEKVGIYPRDLNRNGFFLPHHGVLRESSSTTKLRVVFDGSCKRSAQSSLNEELVAGPALQNDLPTIINRWRRFKIGFRADLEKMFRQILVVQEQQRFQQILWRNSGSEEISIYKLSTVTYGTTPAPFLSIRVLQQLALDEKEKYPLACSVLNSDTYVDDVISGADSLSEAYHLHTQLCSLLNEGKFNLRKWTTNSKELLELIPVDYREKSDIFELNQPNTVKALGLEWNTVDDCFSFKINFENTSVVTKRSLLSDAAKLYDPLGWLAPTTILAKIEFQNLWLLGIEWNDRLPEALEKKWLIYRKNLKFLEQIKIPRWIGTYRGATVEIHGFSDSSKLAYAAAVYAKTISDSGTKVYLIQAKTKVGPIKRLTIPRMELCGATLLAKLVDRITSSLDQEISNVFYWTDSTTVLSWIRGQSSRWPVYVGNRVAEIQRRSHTSQWRYISTRENPADCASRGISSNELVEHELWWHGPKWLTEPSENWPKQPKLNLNETDDISTDPTLNMHSIVADVKQYPELLTRFSSLCKLIRVTAYIFRFKNNTQYNKKSQINGNGKMTGFLSTEELKFARLRLVKLSQEVDFPQEISELQKKGQIIKNSALAQLCPFFDSSQILRVGGRIQNSDLDYCSKHPILLKKQNPLTNLLFLDAHIKTLHGGLIQMQAYVVREYWIISSRSVAKRILRKCITCFKYNSKAAQQMMGNLPSVRLKPARPFKHSGVDYAGPIVIKQSTARNSVTTKGYICLFICMATKALHLEAVTNLSTDAFLAAFRRFVSRRGPCTDMYSDCGTNFVGANKELQILYNRSKSSIPDEISDRLAKNGTKWHFIPPASPNFGGLWEAGVKSTKHHLKRVMQNRILTFEELTTLLAQIESCLNSRPLCPLNSEPSDCNALTPAHFLIGEPTLCVPEEDLLDVNIDRLNRWKTVEKLKQNFWRRWSNEWLCRLQARPKWLKITQNPKIGDLVVVFDERGAPGEWPLARIQDIHPGKDGCVRVVTLFSNRKMFKRPISKIALLPSNDCFDALENGYNPKNIADDDSSSV
ncbi:uncharacterized protein LOC135963802 [Calliphora vicina]|uniref:uncharacterized protein LOC135963802 n=1 Tax=Calliphora vicina TaxID=7373 RepID=UPI00325B594A